VSQELIRKAAEASMKQDVPDFEIGDTVNVSVRIVEGDKERVQVFNGTVIGRRGSGISETFMVRRIVNNEGVERTFPIHSPRVSGIEVVSKGKTRRAKLYYLRNRIGKATRLKERRNEGKAKARADVQREEPQGESESQPEAEAPPEAESEE
jgi:large subunit ribosomal protein L19